MKTIVSILALLAFVLQASAVTQIKDTSAGYQIGGSANEKVGLFGATPVVQPTAAAQAAVTNAGSTNVILTVTSGSAPSLTLTKINFAGFDSGTNLVSFEIVTNVTITAVAPVTNVAVNTVWGSTSAHQQNALTTLVNAIRTALVNLGILKGS